MDNIAMAKFSASDEDSDTRRHKKRSNLKEREENGKKSRMKNSSLYCSLLGENKSHTSRECNALKKRSKDKDNPKYVEKYYKKNSKGLNLLHTKAAHQSAKYNNRNKAFTKKKTTKEKTVVLYDTSDSNPSSISGADN